MSQANEGQSEANAERFYRALSHLSEAELRAICKEIEINYDELPGNQRAEKLKSLVQLIEQQKQKMPHLVNAAKRVRAKPSPVPPTPTPRQPPQPAKPTFDYTMFIIAFGMGLLFAFILFSLGVAPGSERSRPVTMVATRLLESTRIVEATRLIEVTRHVVVTRLVEAPASQATPVAASNPLGEVTQVQPTAALPSPTPSPEPTASPLVFFDDFERGLAPEWQPDYGSMGMSNGNLTVVSPHDREVKRHLIILNGFTWQNFVLTTHIGVFDEGFYPTVARGGILVRQLADGQWVGAIILPKQDGVAFATIAENGEYAVQSGSLVGGGEGNFSFKDIGAELRVEAYGNTYILYVDGRKITSATFPGATSSRIAMWAQNSHYDDDSDGYAPRFEDIRIESIP